MSLVICPGIHDPCLTQSLLQQLGMPPSDRLGATKAPLIFPAHSQPAYSALHVLQFLHSALPPNQTLTQDRQLVFLSFSAGVVGAIGAASAWQAMGGQVKALIAVDGWGVPLFGNFPIHRVSHDFFTHWSSALLGAGETSFYADPPVAHLEQWRSPQTVSGWSCAPQRTAQQPIATNAAAFLKNLLIQYGEFSAGSQQPEP